MEPTYEEAQGTEMDTEMGGAGGEVEGQAGVPYSTYDVEVRMKCVGLVTNEMDVSGYAQSARVMECVKHLLSMHYEQALGRGKELRLPNGTAAGIWSVARPEDEAAMPVAFNNDFMQISLDLVGARSGVRLEGDWEKRVNCGKLIVEMVAVHTALNRASRERQQLRGDLRSSQTRRASGAKSCGAWRFSGRPPRPT